MSDSNASFNPFIVDPRIEIRTFQSNEEGFSLFTQALINLFTGGPCSECGQDRPPPCLCSLEVVERGLVKEAREIIDNLETGEQLSPDTQQVWRKAADDIHIPYWDRSAPVPPVLSDPKLTLAMPDGSTSVVDNILLPLRDLLPSS
ncbi:hypothetical protein BDZ94DRAFT_1312161 [Collybia nuda]|uniref:Uncharacterized protein n=1 Tax=Collybia nuda TaxID=64659 RepID=A0A9P5XYZ3_9AGAR|nr:hypothetical protein BDZ94DRAFT_1312161 [Collybia nuda]